MAGNIKFIDVMRFTAGYWRRQPVRLGIVVSMLITAAVLESWLPSLLSELIRRITAGADHKIILGSLLLLFGAYVSKNLIFGSPVFFLYNAFETRVINELVRDAFDHLLKLPENHFNTRPAGGIISMVLRSRNTMENFEDKILLHLMPSAFVLAGGMFFLMLRFPLMSAVLSLYIVLMISVSIFMVVRWSGPAQTEYSESTDHFSARLSDSISNMPAVKSFAAEEHERSSMHELTGTMRKLNMKAYVSSNMILLVQRLMLTGMFVLMLGGGTFYLFQGLARVEDMAYLMLSYTILQEQILWAGDHIKHTMNSAYNLHGIITMFREKPEETEQMPELSVSGGDIRFSNVTFAYPGKSSPVFSGLNAHIPAGRKVALVGHSGSGKTTFVRLIQGIHIPSNGTITIDGQNINRVSRSSLRRNIALVPQDPALFHRTLSRNIAYGKTDAVPEEVDAAAERAAVAEFIRGLPEGYETMVGERGVRLSGGERQRVAIARAILANRPVLILDEATSSLDSHSEMLIREGLDELVRNRTSIIIAHRLSTIMDADLILVFDKGSIVEAGTHAELSAAGGVYADLLRIQTDGFIAE